MAEKPIRELEFYINVMNIHPNQDRRMEMRAALETILDAFDKGATKEDVSELIRAYKSHEYHSAGLSEQTREPSANEIAKTVKTMCKEAQDKLY